MPECLVFVLSRHVNNTHRLPLLAYYCSCFSGFILLLRCFNRLPRCQLRFLIGITGFLSLSSPPSFPLFLLFHFQRVFMRRFRSARLPLALSAARQPPLSLRASSAAAPLFARPSSTSASLSSSSSPTSSFRPLPYNRRSPSLLSLSHTSKRHCSYRRMCGSRRAEELSGSTNVTHGREILPTNVKPVHYDLTLEPDFEKFTYDGTVVIEYAALTLAIYSAGAGVG